MKLMRLLALGAALMMLAACSSTTCSPHCASAPHNQKVVNYSK